MAPRDIPEATRVLLRGRSMGRCEVCRAPADHAHHRDPRGMGGSTVTGKHRLANLLHLCSRCHDWVESFREQAYEGGWLVPSGDDPGGIRVWLHGVLYWAGWWLLTDEGMLRPVDHLDAGLPERPILPEWAA